MAFPAVCAAAALGVCVHLPPADTLDAVKDLGTEWVRIDFNWDIVEPTKGAYDWQVMDRVVNDANARGLKVFATVGYGAAWASVSGDSGNDGPTNDVPDATEYARFVKDAAARYADGRVHAWGTWNEPNLGDFFEGTMQQWIDSAFIPAVDAIEQGCPSCLIVGPELATIGDQYDTYLEAALKARGSKLDAISMHIYASFPEDDANAGKSKDSFYNKLESHRVLKVGETVVYEGPLSMREVLVAQGFASKPLWITETGREAQVSSAQEMAAQSNYLARVVNAQACRPWWEKTFIYEISEEHPNGMWPDIHWGLVLRTADPDASWQDNFQKKQAFDDLKACIATGPVGSPTCTTPGTGGAGGSGAAGGASGAAGSGAGSGGTPGSGGSSASDGGDEGGCGCRVARQQDAPRGAWLAALALLFAARRRFRKLRPPLGGASAGTHTW